jgi:hypothetical protein
MAAAPLINVIISKVNDAKIQGVVRDEQRGDRRGNDREAKPFSSLSVRRRRQLMAFMSSGDSM